MDKWSNLLTRTHCTVKSDSDRNNNVSGSCHVHLCVDNCKAIVFLHVELNEDYQESMGLFMTNFHLPILNIQHV